MGFLIILIIPKLKAEIAKITCGKLYPIVKSPGQIILVNESDEKLTNGEQKKPRNQSSGFRFVSISYGCIINLLPNLSFRTE